MPEHEALIRIAIEVAAAARAHGNHPFGAILAQDGRVLLAAENTVVTDANPTRHAERNLLDAALSRFETAALRGMTLYSSAEPCVMCAGTLYWAGIATLVYSCSAARLNQLFGATFVIPNRELFQAANRDIRVVGPILEDEGLEVHADFWDKVGI